MAGRSEVGNVRAACVQQTLNEPTLDTQEDQVFMCRAYAAILNLAG